MRGLIGVWPYGPKQRDVSPAGKRLPVFGSTGQGNKVLGLVVGSILLFSPSPAKALSWQDIQNIASQACSTVGYFNLESVRWVCTIYRTVERAIEYWNEIQYDFESLKDQGIYTAIGYGLDWLGNQLGLSQMNQYADQLEGITADLMTQWRAFRERLYLMMADLRQNQIEAIRKNLKEPYTPTWWTNILAKLSPITFGKTISSMVETSQLTSDIGQSGALTAAATKKIMDATDPVKGLKEVAERVLQVTNPIPIPGREGIADKLEKEAATAISSRQVLEVVVKGEAAFLRAQAANTEGILTELRNIAMQSTITNYQMGLQVREILRQRVDEVNQWQADLEAEVAKVQAQAEEVGQTMRMAAGFLRSAWQTGAPPSP